MGRMKRPCCGADYTPGMGGAHDCSNPGARTSLGQPLACVEDGHCWWCGEKKRHRLSIYSLPEPRAHPTILICGDCVRLMGEEPEGTHIGVWSNQP